MKNTETAQSELKGDLLIFAAMAIFGSIPLFLRFFPNIPEVSFLFAFQVVGALSFAILFLKQAPAQQQIQNKYVFLAALAIVALANDILYWRSFRLTEIGNAAVAHQMNSVFLLLFAPLFLREKTRKSEWIGLILSLAGIVVLYGNAMKSSEQNDFLGITLSLGSAALYALLIIFYRYLPSRGLTITEINFWRYTFGAILLLPFMLSWGGFNFGQKDILPLAAYGLLFAFIASGIHAFGMSKTRSMHASIVGKSEPVMASLYAFWFLKETPQIQTIIGGILIIGASIWLAMQNKKENGE